MSKRKVLIAVHQLNIGGVQKALVSALNAIDYSKNEVTLYVRKNRTDLLSLVNKNVSRIIVNKDGTKYYRKPKSVFLMLRLKLLEFLKKDTTAVQDELNNYVISQQMKHEKEQYFSDGIVYDIAVSYIQSHTALFIDDYVNADKKVMFYHGSTDEFHDVNAKVMKQMQKIYCVSVSAMNAVKSFYPEYESKFDYIENFVDYKKIRLDADKFDPNYDKDKLILCTCGRMTQVKGYDLAVKAANILKKQGVAFKWYFVGDGVSRKETQQLIKQYEFEENIVITGMVDNPYPYIKNCDIYVNPSYEEAHPLSIIEGQILNKLVLATSTAGGVALVDDGATGLLCDIDYESIAHKILSVYDNDELKSKIINNLKQKDYDLDYKIFCEKWEKLLEE